MATHDRRRGLPGTEIIGGALPVAADQVPGSPAVADFGGDDGQERLAAGERALLSYIRATGGRGKLSTAGSAS